MLGATDNEMRPDRPVPSGCGQDGRLLRYLPKIRAPMLALYPRASGVITSNEHLEALHEKVVDIRIVRIDSTSHSLQLTSPATCATQVLHFIARHDGIPCHEP